MSERAALYLRLSKEDGDKEESNSIDSQRRLLRSYLGSRQELEAGMEYVDDGYSGTNYNRPAFQRMLQDAKEKKFTCIVVKDLSRLGRNYLETGYYIQHVFLQLSIRFIAVNDQVDTKDVRQQGFDLMLPLRNLFNEGYSQDLSRKVQSSFKVMQRAGAFCGAYASYGYQKSPVDRHKLVIDPYAAKIVQDIYRWYLSGVGQRAIAARLNEQGIPCPSVYKQKNGEKYHNSHKLASTSYWTYATIHRILQNEMYKGNMVQNKSVRKMRGKAKQRPKEEWIIVPGTHEAIIEPKTWERVQELLRKRTRTLDFQQNVSIFAGILTCADCGRAMVKRQYTKKDGSYEWYYTCGSYARCGTKVCSSHRIRQEVLEQILLEDLNQLLSDVEDLRSLVDSQRREQESACTQQEKKIELIETRLYKLGKLKKESYLDYKEGLLSKEEYLHLREDCLQEEQFLTQKLDVFSAAKKTVQEQALDAPWIRQLLEKKKIISLDRETITEFVENITIGEKEDDRPQEIQVCYRFSF